MATLNDHIKLCQALAKDHGDKPVIYSSDDEGNGYQLVDYAPCTGHFNDGEFISTTTDINAVCIN